MNKGILNSDIIVKVTYNKSLTFKKGESFKYIRKNNEFYIFETENNSCKYIELLQYEFKMVS